MTLQAQPSVLCQNSSGDTVTFDINVTAIDLEGDTVYYGVDDTDYKNINHTTEFYDKDCSAGTIFYLPYCHYYPVSYESGQFGFYNNTCPIDWDGGVRLNNSHALITYDGFDGYGLLVDSTCDYADDIVYYDFLGGLDNFWYNQEMWNFDDSNDNMTWSLWDYTNKDEIARLMFTNNATHTSVYYYNDSYRHLVSFTVRDEIDFTVTQLYKDEEVAYLMIDGLSAYAFNLIKTGEAVNFMQQNPISGNYIIQGFVYSAYASYKDISWTTVKPTTISYDEVGIYPYTVYVTDDVHLGSDHEVDTIYLRVVNDPALCTYSDINATWIDSLIGSPFRSFMDTQNLMDEYRGVVYILYFIFTIVFLVGMFKANGVLRLPLASLMSSGMFFGFSYLLNDTATIIGFLVIMALSAVLAVMQK